MRCLDIQILPTSSARNVWGTVRRICIFISEVKGSMHQSILAVPFPLSWVQPLNIHNFFNEKGKFPRGWDKQALHVSWAHTSEIDLGF